MGLSYMWTRTLENDDVESASWFIGKVLIVLLVGKSELFAEEEEQVKYWHILTIWRVKA